MTLRDPLAYGALAGVAGHADLAQQHTQESGNHPISAFPVYMDKLKIDADRFIYSLLTKGVKDRSISMCTATQGVAIAYAVKELPHA